MSIRCLCVVALWWWEMLLSGQVGIVDGRGRVVATGLGVTVVVAVVVVVSVVVVAAPQALHGGFPAWPIAPSFCRADIESVVWRRSAVSRISTECLRILGAERGIRVMACESNKVSAPSVNNSSGSEDKDNDESVQGRRCVVLGRKGKMKTMIDAQCS